MKAAFKTLLAATGIAAALFSSPAFADKWNLPTRSNERNYFTRNILQFADEVKKGTAGKVEIVVHPEDSLVKQPEVKRAVLETLLPNADLGDDYVLKLRGWEVLDHAGTLQDSGVVDGAILLLAHRRRRIVR